MKFPKLRTIGTTLGLASLLVGGSACSKRGLETNSPDEVAGAYPHKVRILKESRKDLKETITPEAKKQTLAPKAEAHPPQKTITDVKPESPQEISSSKPQEKKVVKKRVLPPTPPKMAKKSTPKPITAPLAHTTGNIKDEGADEEITELELCEVEFIDDIKPLGSTKALTTSEEKDGKDAEIIGAVVPSKSENGGIKLPESEKAILGIKFTREQIRDLMITLGLAAVSAYLLRRMIKEVRGQKSAWLTVPLSLATPGLTKANTPHIPEPAKASPPGIAGRYKTDPPRSDIVDAGEGAIILDTKQTKYAREFEEMGWDDTLDHLNQDLKKREAQAGKMETTFAPLKPEMSVQGGQEVTREITRAHSAVNAVNKDGKSTIIFTPNSAGNSVDKGELAETEKIVDQFMRTHLVEDIPVPEPIIQNPFSEPPIALGESEEKARESGAHWKKIKGEWDEIEAGFDATRDGKGDLILEAKEGDKANHKLDPAKGEILEAKSEANETDSPPHNPLVGWHDGESTLPLGTTRMAQVFMDIDRARNAGAKNKGHERIPEDTYAEVERNDQGNPDLQSKNPQELERTGESTLPLNDSDTAALFISMERQSDPGSKPNQADIPNTDKIWEEMIAEAGIINTELPSPVNEEGWHGLGSMPPIDQIHTRKEDKIASTEDGDEWEADWKEIVGDTTPPPLTANMFKIARYRLRSIPFKNFPELLDLRPPTIPSTNGEAMGRSSNKDDWGDVFSDVQPPGGPAHMENDHDKSDIDSSTSSTNSDDENDWSNV